MKRLPLFGPILFAFILLSLTAIKYDFLLTLGWHPINAPTFDWPSGLALGPYGWVMTLTFVLAGGFLTLLAYRLFLDLKPGRPSQAGTLLMALAGLFLAALAFTTDPTLRITPATWHGRLHDLSFVLLGLTMFPAMIVLGFAFRRDEHWKNLAFYTWGTLMMAGPAFFIKGAAFYLFLLSILVWQGIVANRAAR